MSASRVVPSLFDLSRKSLRRQNCTQSDDPYYDLVWKDVGKKPIIKYVKEKEASYIKAFIWFTSTYNAVILFQYNKKDYLLVKWNRENKQQTTFDQGQWLMNKKIYPERCTISPDGKYFIYFYADIRDKFKTYTIVSEVPYFTAHTVYSEEGTWTGGAKYIQSKTRNKLYIQVSSKANLMKGNIIDFSYPLNTTKPIYIDTKEKSQFVSPDGSEYVYDQTSGKLFDAEGNILLDVSWFEFENVKAPYT